MRRPYGLAPLLVVAAAAAVVLAGCGSSSAKPDQVLTQTPNVVGMSLRDATKLLARSRLRAVSTVRWTAGDPGRVLAQVPIGGALRPQRDVGLVVSARGALIPKIVGLPVPRAVAELKSRGFAVVRPVPASGVVKAQHPAAGWSRPHAPVRLDVVNGEAAVLIRVEQAFATQGVPGLQLADVRCARARVAGAYTCSGAAIGVSYRTTLLVTFRDGKIAPWQPPAKQRSKAGKQRSKAGVLKGHAKHAHAGGRHGHTPKAKPKPSTAKPTQAAAPGTAIPLKP